MKQTVNFYEFEQAFRSHDRYDEFGYDGLKALFEHLKEYEQDTGEEIELDVIALCCDYSKHDSALEAAKLITDYDSELDGETDEEETEESALEALRDQTTVIECRGGAVIVQSF